jgi:hypothetical protein
MGWPGTHGEATYSAGLLDEIAISTGGPHGLDIDPARNRAYVACDDGVVAIVDLNTDGAVAAVPITGAPDAIWYPADADRLHVAIGDPGLIEVVGCAKVAVSERVSTERGAHTTALDTRAARRIPQPPGGTRNSRR